MKAVKCPKVVLSTWIVNLRAQFTNPWARIRHSRETCFIPFAQISKLRAQIYTWILLFSPLTPGGLRS